MQHKSYAALIGGIGVVLLGGAAPASATQFTWDTDNSPTVTCTSNMNGGLCVPDTVGSNGVTSGEVANIYSFTDGSGHTLTAEAYIAPNGATNVGLQTSFLGMYTGTGLGVEIASSPGHAVDNNINKDLIVFKFPAGLSWDAVSVGLSLFGSTLDSDATILVGTPSSANFGTGGLSAAQVTTINANGVAGFAGVTLSQIDALAAGGTLSGFKRIDSNTTGTGDRTISALNDGIADVYLIVAASLNNPDANSDYFKVNSIVGTTVPEPSTLALFLIGAAGVYARRRMSKAEPAA